MQPNFMASYSVAVIVSIGLTCLELMHLRTGRLFLDVAFFISYQLPNDQLEGFIQDIYVRKEATARPEKNVNKKPLRTTNMAEQRTLITGRMRVDRGTVKECKGTKTTKNHRTKDKHTTNISSNFTGRH